MKSLAHKLFLEEKVEESLAKYKECISKDPWNYMFNATVYFNMAMIYEKSRVGGDYSEQQNMEFNQIDEAYTNAI